MSLRDANRSRKTYPYIRIKSVPLTNINATIEANSVAFTEADTGSYTFTVSFSSTPIVTVTAVDNAANNSANVNIYISAVSTTAVTFKSSAIFTGVVHFHAIYTP